MPLHVRALRFVAMALASACLLVLPAAAPAHSGRSHHHVSHRFNHHHGRHHPKPAAPIKVQMLGVNDFHGALSANTAGTINVPPATPGGPVTRVNAGGAAFLAAHLAMLRAKYPAKFSITVGAGDLIGASPLNSALFHDEPTINAFNQMGLSLSSVGNHEFDDGYRELLRIQHGGCPADEVCDPDSEFQGADFPYLAANVRLVSNGKRAFPGWVVKRFGAVKIAFIGAVLKDTPTIVSPAGISNLTFGDEATAINDAVKEIKKRGGADLYTVEIHQGDNTTGFYNECVGVSGDLDPILAKMTKDVEVVFSGHTHQAYNCRIGGRTVVQASSNGRIISEVVASFDRRTHDVFSVASKNSIVTQDVTPDPAVQAIVDDATARSAPLANRVVGSSTAALTRALTPAGESNLGDIIADSQLAAGQANGGDAQIALMNIGGIRNDILPATISGGEAPGQITYGEAFNVQPFGNILQTLTLTGDQLRRVLEQQFDNPSAGQSRVLQISNGFTYSYDLTRPAGSRVDPASMKLNGVTINPTGTYRVTVNNFIAGGGDNFTVLKEATNVVGIGQDIDAFTAYLTAHNPTPDTPRDRIVKTG